MVWALGFSLRKELLKNPTPSSRTILVVPGPAPQPPSAARALGKPCSLRRAQTEREKNKPLGSARTPAKRVDSDKPDSAKLDGGRSAQ